MRQKRPKLPAILRPLAQFRGYHHFGVQQKILRAAFDNGITTLTLQTTTALPPAKRNATSRTPALTGPTDELVISTKAGFGMWRGPYGDHGSRKYLIASLTSPQAHEPRICRYLLSPPPDDETPVEETMGALTISSGAAKRLRRHLTTIPNRQNARSGV